MKKAMNAGFIPSHVRTHCCGSVREKKLHVGWCLNIQLNMNENVYKSTIYKSRYYKAKVSCVRQDPRL